MNWAELYGKDTMPTWAQIQDFMHTPLWNDVNDYLQQAYAAQPKLSYSGCSQPGWNVKYQKAGKALCTLYPMADYFIALVVIGEKERTEMELLLPTFTPYIQALYEGARQPTGATWLMTAVTDETILADVKRLIALRRQPK